MAVYMGLLFEDKTLGVISIEVTFRSIIQDDIIKGITKDLCEKFKD